MHQTASLSQQAALAGTRTGEPVGQPHRPQAFEIPGDLAVKRCFYGNCSVLRCGPSEGIRMDQLEHADNKQLLSALAGKPVAEALMEQYTGLTNLAQASFDELQLVKGVGKSKAAAIKSAFLLAQRLARESVAESPLLDTPERVADLLREQNRVYTVENFQVILLNTRRRLIGVHHISHGTLDTILVHPREVFKPAITANAAAIVLVHNHPSGVIPHPVLCRMAGASSAFSV